MIIAKKLNCNANPFCLTINVKMTDEERVRKFGLWLADNREKAGLAQKFVAEKADVNPVQLSRIENGHSGARKQTVIDIVDSINKYSKTGHRVNKDEALNLAGFFTNSSGFIDTSGLDENDKDKVKSFVEFLKTQKGVFVGETNIKAVGRIQTIPSKYVTNAQEFMQVLDYLGMDTQFAGGLAALEKMSPEELQEFLDSIVVNHGSAKAKKLYAKM